MSVRTHQELDFVFRLAAQVIAFVLFGGVCHALDEPSTPTQIEGVDVEALPSGPSLLFKDPQTGETTRVRGFTQQMLEDLLKRGQLQSPSRLYDYVELRIDGEAKDGFAYLNVQLRIEVLVDEERVAVPVGFDEFRIRGLQHKADSEVAWGKPDTQKLPVKNWILFGKGMHQLTFDLIGQIRESANGQKRIRIDAPLVATSSLSLAFDELVESAQLVNGIPPVLTSDAKTGTTQVQAYGLTEQTELVWTPKPTEKAEFVSVRATAPATMKLDLTIEPGSLKISQPISISGGSIDVLRVRLPEKFIQESIDAIDADGNSIITGSYQSEDVWIVQFSDPVNGPVTLTYDLGLEDKGYSDDVTVMLPEVIGASNVSGNLEVHVPYGLDVQFAEKNIRRIRVASASDSRTRVTAYRLLSTSSRLSLTISETDAFYSVIPHVSFETVRQEDTLAITVRFKVNVLRGSLPDLLMNWPDFQNEGWRISSGDIRLITDELAIPITGSSPDKSTDGFQIFFPERQSGQFEVEIQAFRDLESVQQADGILFLPDIPSSTPHPVIVSLIESDADSIVLSRPGEQPEFPGLPTSRWPAELKNRETPLSVWQVDSPAAPVQIRIVNQTPEVRVSVETALSLAGDSIQVSEVIRYDVRHENVSEIQLSGPGKPIVVRLRETAEPLVRIRSTAEFEVYSLPYARRGEFEVLVDYFWNPPAPSLQAAGVELPIVRPVVSDPESASFSLATNSPQSILLQSSSQWKRIYSDRFEAAWQTDQLPKTVPIQLQHGLQRPNAAGPAFVIVDSANWSSLLLTSVTYIYDTQTDDILFSLDSNSELRFSSVNGNRVTPIPLSNGDSGSTIYRVPADDSSVDTTIVRLVVKQPFRRQHDLFSSLHPAFPKPIGASDSYTTLWRLAQTSQHSLFEFGSKELVSTGGNLSARIFGRDKQQSEETLAGLLLPYNQRVRTAVVECLNRTADSSPRFEVLAGNVYSERHTVVAVSQRLVFLLSAVLAVVVYFVCLRLSTTYLIFVGGMATIGVAVLCSYVPAAAQVILLQATPLTGVAVFAAFGQRHFLAERNSPFRSLGDSDGNTVFAMDQPVTEIAVTQSTSI